jgi:hypothetical protein
MNPRNKALWVGGVLFVLTALVTLLREMGAGYAKGIWVIWAFCAWNFFAYGFSKDMWPWQFVELKGGKEGKPGERGFWFWFTAVIYLAFLATMAFAD